jgi:hypothetical protein
VRDIGEIERTVLLLEAAGLSPRRFAGRDLVAAIRARRRANGSIAGYVSYTAFGILALRAADVPAGGSTVAWLAAAQNDNGGFGLVPSATSDSDMTGAALQALAAVGRGRSATARRGVEWLRANQNDDGGFGQFRGRNSNAQSTAYAVQGLVAVKAGGAALSRGLAYLRGLQRRDGSVAYSSTSRQTPVWVTAQALMALERAPLPVATVPRAKRARAARDEPEAAANTPAPASPANDGGGREKAAEEAKPARSAADTKSGEPGSAKAAGGDRETVPGEAAGVLPADGTATPRADPAAATGQSAARAAEDAGDGGVPVGLVAAAVATTMAVVVLFRRLLPRRLRRRLLPRRLRRSGDAVT